MTQLHPRARTTPVTRKEIQDAPEYVSHTALAKKYGVHRKTIAKWRNRDYTKDTSHAPKKHGRQKLTDADLVLICKTRELTGLPIDDLLSVVNKQLSTPISRSRLGAILKEKGLTEKKKRVVQEFKEYKPGFIHIDCTSLPKINGVQSKAFCAIDRVSKWAYVEIHERKTIENSESFLKNVIKHCPLKIHRILTDNGMEFTYKLLTKNKTEKLHAFDKICQQHKIIHKLTKFKHPWTNGQVERFNRQLKEKTVYCIRYKSTDEMKTNIQEWLIWYNNSCQLKSIKGKTPIQFIKDYLKTDT